MRTGENEKQIQNKSYDNRLQILPEIVHPGDHGDNQRHPQKGHPDRIKTNGKILSVEDKKKDRGDFENRFVLPQLARRNNDPWSGGNPSQSGNGNFPSDNDDDHPGWNLSRRNECDQGGDDQKLVRKGIKKFPQGRLHAAPPGKISIEGIRHSGSEKKQGGEKLIFRAYAKKAYKDERNRQNPEDRHSVGQAQDMLVIEFIHRRDYTTGLILRQDFKN